MTDTQITKRQKDLLSILYQYIINSGYPPTFEEMREKLGVSSNQSVVDLLRKLEEKHLIIKSESSARGIAIRPLGYKVLGKPALAPFLGATTAGLPAEPMEISGEWQQISSEASQLKDKIFLLKISGDSMINAGIDDGDLVLIKETKEFSSGDIVLADVDGESTIKRFISEDKPPYVYLKPENPKYKLIPARDNMRMKGKVISVFKKSYWVKVN